MTPRTYTESEVQALVAAAIEQAVQACGVEESARLEEEAKEEGCEDECLTLASHIGRCIELRIRALATEPQRAALDALIAEARQRVIDKFSAERAALLAAARQEGAEREREEIVGIVHDYHARCYGTAERAEDATVVLEARIRARGTVQVVVAAQ